MADDELRLLLPRAALNRLTRRRFVGMGAVGAAALGLGLPACGDDDDETSGTTSTTGEGPGEIEDSLNIYTWAEYQAPENVDAFRGDTGARISLDVYESNEEAQAKLELSGGKGYDIVVPSGSFIPVFARRDLLLPLDKSKLPNFENLDPAFLDQPWDPGNKYSVVKDWGSTGFLYDAEVVEGNPTDWAGFFDAAAQDGVSGNVSVLDDPAEVAGLVFWRDGIVWTTEKAEDLDHAEKVLLDELVPHIKGFESYPPDLVQEGTYALAQAWNGDARQAVLADPDRYKFVLGAPKTELWIDNWCILAEAEHPEAAYAWINYVLDPEVSALECNYTGYNTAVKGIEEFLPDDFEQRELVFFTDEEIERFEPGVVTAAQDRLVEILNKVKAAASS